MTLYDDIDPDHYSAPTPASPARLGLSPLGPALSSHGALGAFMAWLWVWLCRGGAAPSVPDYAADARQYEAVWNYPWNRQQRRMRACYGKIPASRRPSQIDRVVSRGLTPTQRMERRARLSLDGRIRVYKFQYWARRQGRFQNTPSPSADANRAAQQLGFGFWNAQAWPD